MSGRGLCTLFALVVLAYPVTAATYYVGGCHSGSFPTITAAVNSVAAGSTIKVCSGSYYEQVFISKDLTLQGIGLVELITPDNMGSTFSEVFDTTTAFGRTNLAPVVWVQSGAVHIQNISVLAQTSISYLLCPTVMVGFFYGISASGTLNHVATYTDPGFINQCTISVWAENEGSPKSFTVQNSLLDSGLVAGSDKATNLTVNITGNQIVQSNSQFAAIGISYGLYLYQVTAVASGNFLTGPRSSDDSYIGIENWGATNTTITNNTLQFAGYIPLRQPFPPVLYREGIHSQIASMIIKSNKISGTQTAISLAFGSAGNVVSGNTINSDNLGILLSGATFTGVNTFANTFCRVEGNC